MHPNPGSPDASKRANPSQRDGEGQASAEGGLKSRGSLPFRPLEAIVALGGIQFLTMFAGLARTKLLAVLLGPAVLGIVGVIDQLVLMVVHAGSLSTPFAAVKFLSRRIDDGIGRIRFLFTGLFRITLVASLVATGGVAAAMLLRPELLSADLRPYRLPLLLALGSVPALAMTAYLRNSLAAFSRHREAALAAFIGAVALVGAAYLGIELGGVTGLFAGNLVVNGLLAWLVFVFLVRSSGVGLVKGRAVARTSLREERDLSWYLSLFHLLTLVTPLAYLVARVTVLNQHGDVAAGLYYAAYGLAVAARVVLHQGSALYLAPLVNRPDPPKVRVAATADYLRVLAVVAAVATLPLVLFPELWIWLLYSPEFTEAARFLAPFVVGELVLLFGGVFLYLLLGFDDLRGFLTISVAGHTAILLLAFLLTPPLGPVGVAYAFIAGNSGMLLGAVLRVRKTYAGPGLLSALLLLSLCVGMVSFAGWWAVSSGLEPGPVVRVLAYLGMSLALLPFLSRDERAWIVAPWRRHRGGE